MLRRFLARFAEGSQYAVVAMVTSSVEGECRLAR